MTLFESSSRILLRPPGGEITSIQLRLICFLWTVVEVELVILLVVAAALVTLSLGSVGIIGARSVIETLAGARSDVSLARKKLEVLNLLDVLMAIVVAPAVEFVSTRTSATATATAVADNGNKFQ